MNWKNIGQDAQFTGTQHNYTLNSNGKTVFNNVTKLTWMRGPNTTLATPTRTDKMTLNQEQSWIATVDAMAHGGFSDWRLPTMKELYSLMSFKGTDASSFSGTDTSVLTPFIDTGYFNFAYGQAAYIPFGRGLGWPDMAGRWADVHGAGCQRSDPKVGPPFPYATTRVVTKGGVTYMGYAFGPQGDAIRGLNFVRLVRAGDTIVTPQSGKIYMPLIGK